MKYFKRITLESLSQIIKEKLISCPKESIRINYWYIIEDEIQSARSRNLLQGVIIGLLFFVALIFTSSELILRKSEYQIISQFIMLVSIYSLIPLLYFIYLVDFMAFTDYEKLLKILRDDKELFSRKNYSIERIKNQVDDLVIVVRKGMKNSSNESDIWDTKKIVLFISLANEKKEMPNFNSSQFKDLARKATGCSAERFEDFISDPYGRRLKSNQKGKIIDDLETIKTDLNLAGYNKFDDLIEQKIREIKNR